VRVLKVNTYHYLRGGDSRLVFKTAQAIEKRNHKVHHFAMQNSSNYKCNDETFFTREINFPQVIAVKSFPNIFKVLTTSLFSLEAKVKISNLLDYTVPDIIHIHSIRHHITKSILLEFKKRKLPVVWTLHDYKEICPNTTLFNGTEICERCKGRKFRNLIKCRCKRGSLAASLVTYLEAQVNTNRFYDRCVDMFISPSQFLIDKFKEFGYSGDRICRIPNFINTEEFEPCFSGQPFFLFFGRIERIKGVETLINAFRVTDLSRKGWRLVIAGEGESLSRLKDMTSEIEGLEVEFVGYQSGKKLTQLIQQSGAVVVPSEWYENYPFSVLEAMACGKVVIGADIGGIPEQIHHARTGFLFTSGDVSDLAKRMLEFMKLSPEVRLKMGHQARLKIERQNNEASHVDALLSLYKRLIKEKMQN
jgi:glycosyltransferase involved in cell wall biosynthesis